MEGGDDARPVRVFSSAERNHHAPHATVHARFTCYTSFASPARPRLDVDAMKRMRRFKKVPRDPSPPSKLRADVLERVRVRRVAILSRARGDADRGGSLRDEVQGALREILHDELSRAERVRRSCEASACGRAPGNTTADDDRSGDRRDGDDGDPGGGGDGGDEKRFEASAQLASSGWHSGGVEMVTPRLSSRSPRHVTRDDDDDGMWDDDVSPPPRRPPARDGMTWGEAAGTGLLSVVEYEELMCAMHASIEEELRAEEEALLARELERAEAEDANDLAGISPRRPRRSFFSLLSSPGTSFLDGAYPSFTREKEVPSSLPRTLCAGSCAGGPAKLGARHGGERGG